MEVAERSFLILGLPRTRTAWLANFLTWGDMICWHELSGRMSAADQMRVVLTRGAKCVGNADSGAIFMAEELMQKMPDLRVVVIRRDWEESLHALCKLTGAAVSDEMRASWQRMDEILEGIEAKASGVLVVEYESLGKSQTVEAVWRHCVGEVPFPSTRFSILSDMNVQMEPGIIHRAARGVTQVPGRTTPLNEVESELLRLVLEAHGRVALRTTKEGLPNISAAAVQIGAQGSGAYAQSIASGLLTLGGVHAPIETTVEMLEWDFPARGAQEFLKSGHPVPGWGNSFVKGEHDPEWAEVRAWLETHRRDIWAKIEDVTAILHASGKRIFPNPSIYTAAAAIALHIPARAAGFLFVSGRLGAWTQHYLNQLK